MSSIKEVVLIVVEEFRDPRCFVPHQEEEVNIEVVSFLSVMGLFMQP